ncbi:M23 family metallopeptidase [Psychroserpens sp.]|uniref:M23 family metallopeptidase n=1 Tax=Psychroserpens sp. TaxID=2020870 RepID=UPI001B253274|nr:peptidoglycan DD-metalloendopeptidase family protein [Psychroserpens sp.]MBO6605580.1 peptidoglycan DD-metalloendopeptidase family protein [Psychroserpens sp.]MBO6630039.1 peptidoglycan DD-metalloendopeptidase family protein [Psychroserpens sp.]MBO6653611.1 peptidoglycan DD-metalloendopeptidase family protein [Psychroserpens sp.]MBO6681932.1 peptidoglycan DD-metalloendopeptidase family protein [Psychroserpens sp.]MBO6748954.1 peptidoglycan DD-metalloendopeptidase family protein [Psychroserp
MQSKYLLIALCISIGLFSCKDDKESEQKELQSYVEPEPAKEFGFVLDDFVVKRDTIRKGDSFGEILERNKIGYPKIFNIAEKAKDSFDIRKLQIGKPYTLLCTKDSLELPQCFIYQPNNVDYVVINFSDSIEAYTGRKPISIVQREASGIIQSSFSQTMDSLGLPADLTYNVADIYAWTLDFYKLQRGDRFKLVYKQRFIEDSIYAGIESIDATYFEHKGDPLYAFRFVADSTKGIVDYFDENTKSLRRTFLTAPIKFRYRISSRYNLKRRIAYYGYKVRPHKGTDFAAAIGTPIIATANGTVTESTRRGGNGKYVKIKHNGTYSTQYLHMKAQNVKKGDYVKQGDVIGWVGMTGNTGGPHVCYRFWKNGKQVDPFKQKLPAAESIPDSIKTDYLDFIKPYKSQLDNIQFVDNKIELPSENETLTSKIQ